MTELHELENFSLPLGWRKQKAKLTDLAIYLFIIHMILLHIIREEK